jgi:hypothetical protein
MVASLIETRSARSRLRGWRPVSGGMLASQNRMFWNPAASVQGPGKLGSSLGYSLSWRMPRAFVPGSVIQAAQAKPMSAMPSSVFSPGVS